MKTKQFLNFFQNINILDQIFKNNFAIFNYVFRDKCNTTFFACIGIKMLDKIHKNVNFCQYLMLVNSELFDI